MPHQFAASLRSVSRPAVFESCEPRRLLSAGVLDPTFGQGGYAYFQSPTTLPLSLAADDAAAAPGGKLVVIGRTNVEPSGYGVKGAAGLDSYVLGRFNADGSPDATFAAAGIVRIPGTELTNTQSAPAVAVGADGDVLVGGWLGGQFNLLRFTPDGRPDPTFGTGGAALTPLANTNSFYQRGSIALQAGGGIVVSTLDDAGHYTVARYTAGGDLDQSFGVNGVAGFTVRETFDRSEGLSDAPQGSMTLDGQGRLVLAVAADSTYAARPTGATFLVARLTAGGAPDESFGVHGQTWVSLDAPRATLGAVTVTAGGQIAVAGSSRLPATRHGNSALLRTVARLTDSGELDPSFGAGGLVNRPVTGYQSAAASGLLALPDGGLVESAQDYGGGFSVLSPTPYALVAGYRADGSPDPRFGAGGQRLLHFPQPAGVGPLVALPDGQFLSPLQFDSVGLHAIRLNPTGRIDRTYGGTAVGVAGIATEAAPYLPPVTIGKSIRTPHGGLLVEVQSDAGSAFTLFKHDGSVNRRFAGRGSLRGYNYFISLTAQDDGKILAGTSELSSGTPVGLTRFNADGTLDSTFGKRGTVLIPAAEPVTIEAGDVPGRAEDVSDIAVGRDGSIYAFATYGTSGSSISSYYRDSYIFKYSARGTLLGQTGGPRSPFPAPVVGLVGVRRDGKLVARGINNLFAESFVRYNADLTLDTRFGNHGVTAALVSSKYYEDVVALGPDGSILVAGQTLSRHATVGIFRYLPDGKQDKSFGAGGIAVLPDGTQPADVTFDGLAVDADGRIVVAEGKPDLPNGPNVRVGPERLLRYTAGGALDSSFGDGGVATVDLGPHPNVNGLFLSAGGIVLLGSADSTADGDSRVVLAGVES